MHLVNELLKNIQVSLPGKKAELLHQSACPVLCCELDGRAFGWCATCTYP